MNRLKLSIFSLKQIALKISLWSLILIFVLLSSSCAGPGRSQEKQRLFAEDSPQAIDSLDDESELNITEAAEEDRKKEEPPTDPTTKTASQTTKQQTSKERTKKESTTKESTSEKSTTKASTTKASTTKASTTKASTTKTNTSSKNPSAKAAAAQSKTTPAKTSAKSSASTTKTTTSTTTTITATTTIPIDPQERIVYITDTGSKYHKGGCRHLAKSKIKINVKDAIAKGYEACKVCKP